MTRRTLIKSGAGLAAIIAAGKAPAALVRSMLAARQSICAGRKLLPYDSEVEWLGCTSGNNFTGPRIYTGIHLDEDCELEAVISTQTTGSYNLIGARNNSSSNNISIGIGATNNQMVVDFCKRDVALYRCSVAASKNVFYRGVANKHSRKVYAMDGSLLGENTTDCPDTIYTPEVVVGINTAGSSGSKTTNIAYVRASRNGVDLLRYKPVRFTNELGDSEGAMYDEVTKRLFRTGNEYAFTIGPDAVSAGGGGV